MYYLFTLLKNRSFGFILLLISYSSSVLGQVSYENAFPNVTFNVPVEIQNAADGSDRLFVIEQQGIIKVFENNNQITSNEVEIFLDISSEVNYSAGQEVGLLGLAFHPQFSSNRYIYVYYTDKTTSHRINIVRYQVSDSDPNLVDVSSKTYIAQFTKNQTQSNHNGGKIAFGPDGYLYISIGDGGGGGDPEGNAQNLNTVFGSILRLDIDVNGDNPIESNPELPNGNYEIPLDNPRVGQSGLKELYAWGIRNTWKMSFDEEGRLWGADVGQNEREEINLITVGGNFGWNRFEGNIDYRSNTGLVTNPDIEPIFTYGHDAGDQSITGGYVYRGSLASSSLRNKYIFGDYLTGRVWALTYNQTSGAASSELLFRASGESISSFGEDESGELYFSGYGSNASIFKISESIQEPTIPIPVDGVGVWKDISNGINGTVTCIIQSEDNFTYVGGNFNRAGSLEVANFAMITPDGQWQALGSGTNGQISAIAIAPNEDIYVGGDFTQIGDTNANNIAFWNGSVWSALEDGTSGPVMDLQFDNNGNLFVGGVFADAGGQTVNNIAIWENSTWAALTDSATGVAGTNNEIRSLAFDADNNLFIGGNFDAAGGVSAPRIAQWNGSNWVGLGEGTSGFVQAITIEDNFLYAGGNFNLVGSKTANRIARWNFLTRTWETLGFGLSGSVNSIVSDGSHIFVGGDFEIASDTENTNKIVNNIARWNSTDGWEALGPARQVGTNSSVESLAFSTSLMELFVGGNFNRAGGEQYNNIAIWSEVFCTENSIIPEYEVNGKLDSGSNTLSLNEGDTLRLSIASDTTNFSILFPNGQEVSGDYSFGSLTTALSGTYIFSNDLGCKEILDIVINASPSQDRDNDGIIDEQDSCSDTPSGETVNSYGCSESQLDEDNDGVFNTEDICPNSLNGEIVDFFGCSASQNDIDNDGVTNDLDRCPETLSHEQVNENGCSLSQIDSDFDGVVNSMDICPGTTQGVFVDENGCEQNRFPIEQFTIRTTANSCLMEANGVSQIISSVSGVYTAKLVKDSQVIRTYEFTEALDIERLVSGNYEICITSPSINTEYCYPFFINNLVEELQVMSSLNKSGTVAFLTLRGASKYFITINGKLIETELNEISLDLNSGINTITVRSENSCQRIYEDTILSYEPFLMYPNPAKDFVTIYMGHAAEKEMEIFLFTRSGKLVLSKNHSVIDNKITLDTTSLSPGIFFLHVVGAGTNKAFQLVKS